MASGAQVCGEHVTCMCGDTSCRVCRHAWLSSAGLSPPMGVGTMLSQLCFRAPAHFERIRDLEGSLLCVQATACWHGGVRRFWWIHQRWPDGSLCFLSFLVMWWKSLLECCERSLTELYNRLQFSQMRFIPPQPPGIHRWFFLDHPKIPEAGCFIKKSLFLLMVQEVQVCGAASPDGLFLVDFQGSSGVTREGGTHVCLCDLSLLQPGFS